MEIQGVMSASMTLSEDRFSGTDCKYPLTGSGRGSEYIIL